MMNTAVITSHAIRSGIHKSQVHNFTHSPRIASATSTSYKTHTNAPPRYHLLSSCSGRSKLILPTASSDSKLAFPTETPDPREARPCS